MRWLAGAALLVWTACGWAASLGSMEVLSSLGQPLRVKVALSNYHPDDGPNCVRATLRPIDGGRALHPRVALIQNGISSSLQLTTRESVNEPAVNIVISLGCETPLQRDYQVLLDPQLTPATVPRPEPKQEQATARVREKPVRSAPPPRTAQALSDEAAVAPAPRPRKPARTRIAAEAANAADSAATAATPQEQPAPKKKTAKSRPKKVERSVLRLSGAALPEPAANAAALAAGGTNATAEEPVDAPMQLKRADSLTLPELPTSPGRMAELQAEQEKFAALLRDEDPVQSVQQSMRKVQAELESVRAETARLREQSLNDKTALATLRADSLHWIGTLGWLLLICLSAIAWLIWRLSAAKNEASRAEWAALVAARNTQTANFDITEDAQDHAALPEPEAVPVAPPVAPPAASPAAPAPLRARRRQPAPEPAPAQEAPAAPQVADEPRMDQQQADQQHAGEQHADEQPQAAAAPAVPESAGVPPYLLRPVGANAASRAADHSLKAAEISDVVELAEAWMALNDPHKVLELLDPFAAVEHPESPLPWLCLLEVYRTLGQQEKYEAILERIRSRFNVKLAPWNEETDGEPPKTLADYPHISANIISLWENTGEVVAYLQQLQRDNRHGTRNGFDLPVYRDILKLISLAEHADRADGKAVMPERVRAILFPAPREAAAPVAAATQASPAVNPSVKAQLPVRPRYVTTSYQQRALRERAAAQPNAAAARQAPAEQPAAAPSPAPSAAVADANPAARPSGAAVTQQAVKKERWPAYPTPAAAPAKAAPAAAAAQQQSQPAPQPLPQAKPQSQSQPQPVTQKAPEPHEDLCPIGVKLHLAVAYHDIGDKEGAYVLLNEVLNEGDQAQVEQARKLMARLGV